MPDEANLRINNPNGFQQVHRTHSGNIGRGQWLVKRDANKALCGKIIDLFRSGQFEQSHTRREIGQIIFDQM